MASNDSISQAEMWDDSLLVDSWNEALEEYKVRANHVTLARPQLMFIQHYHSIHARGEKVEDVIKAAEQQSNGSSVQLSLTVSRMLTCF